MNAKQSLHLKKIGIMSMIVIYGVLLVGPIFAEDVKEGTVSAMPTTSIDYTLPYPGILPDNPLYFFKATRDRIISFMIADPIKKASFDLLQADKRLESGVYLIEKKDEKQIPLAITTISKGENYFEEAVHIVQSSKAQRKDMKDISEKLHTAALKHEEVIGQLSKKIPATYRKTFTILRTRIENIVIQTTALQPK